MRTRDMQTSARASSRPAGASPREALLRPRARCAMRARATWRFRGRQRVPVVVHNVVASTAPLRKLDQGRHPALSRPDPLPARSRHSAALVILAWGSRDACASRRGRAPTSRAASLRADPRGRSGSRRGRPRCPPRAGRSTPRPRAPRHVAEPSRSSTRLAATSSSPRVATSASSTWSGTRRCVPPPTVVPTRGPLTTRIPTLPYRSAHPPRTGHAQRRRAIPRP